MTFKYPADVEGYSSEAECRALYDLACQTPQPGIIVELGSYKGRSAIAMAQSGRAVHCVDRFQPESYFFDPLPDHEAGNFSARVIYENAERYDVEVIVHGSDTAEMGRMWRDAWLPNVDLLFIDAGHEYAMVKADMDAWFPLVAEDGVVVFDDSLWPGVTRAILELDDWTPIPGPQVGGLTAMKRILVESGVV